MNNEQKLMRFQVLEGARTRLYSALSAIQYAVPVSRMPMDEHEQFQSVQRYLYTVIERIENEQHEIATHLTQLAPDGVKQIVRPFFFFKEKKMNWISVEDKLPEKATAVCVYHHTLGQHVSFFDGAGIFTHPCYNLKSGVTHWRPLPDPPCDITIAAPDSAPELPLDDDHLGGLWAWEMLD